MSNDSSLLVAKSQIAVQSHRGAISLDQPKVDLPILRRNRLLQRIKRGLQKGNLFIAAPAGYGKSTLLRSLIAQQPDSAYVALTPADADLHVLRARLFPLLSQVAVLVLDDVHHLVDATETLTWLVECLQSARPRWVVGGRLIPAPLQAGKVPSEQLSMADLAFGVSESKAILRGLEEKLVAAWQQRTEGWPLALVLLARQTPEKLALDATISTNDQLFAYLAESVFAALPRELAEFIQLSALPLHFNNELLAELLDQPVVQIAALRAEVQRRNLFLEASDKEGWFHYHDLVRLHLLGQVDNGRRSDMAKRLVTWFETAGDLRMAIEHAIEGGLYEQAARLMTEQATTLSFDLGWYQSYRRWVFAMPKSVNTQFPLLFMHLGMAIAYHQRSLDEGLAFLEQASELAHNHRDPNVLTEVKVSLAGVYNHHGLMEKSALILQEVITQPALPLGLQLLAYLRLASANAMLFRLREANLRYTQLEKIVDRIDDLYRRDGYRAAIRHNRALLIDAIRGDLGKVAGALEQNLSFDQDKPARLEGTYVGFCILHESLGEWDALAEDLRWIKRTRLQQETDNPEAEGIYQMNAKWEMFFWAAYHLGKRNIAATQTQIDEFVANVSDPEANAAGQWLQAWLYRAQGHYADCVKFVDTSDLDPSDPAHFYCSATIFERAAAAFFAGHSDWDAGIEPHIRFHMQLGCKHYLLRWRILFALACYGSGTRINTDKHGLNELWRKHVTFVLCSLKRYHYDRLLIQREPELAAHFWALCLAENIQPETALRALAEIGHTELIFGLFNHVSPAVRVRALTCFSLIGDEATIPKLAEALTYEKNASVRAQIEATLAHLEALPPPTLRVTMMGEFAVQRGNRLITADDWQRPGARRLFQYFVLNQGQPLQRERILEDLWPNSDPTAARGSFKSVYSLLRIAIEPYLRPKSTSRYLQVEQESYTLNPQRRAAILHSDISEFVQVVRAVLKEADLHEVRQMPTAFVAALEGWKPLAAELSYEAWAAETQERLRNLYVEGCLHAGDAMLDIDKPIEAGLWAERVIAVAPWSEEAWEQLMRAQARQGNRTIALKSYEAAVVALKRELDAPPSAKLTWLAKRLRIDEEI